VVQDNVRMQTFFFNKVLPSSKSKWWNFHDFQGQLSLLSFEWDNPEVLRFEKFVVQDNVRMQTFFFNKVLPSSIKIMKSLYDIQR
jgi:hypothetical protein